MFYLKKKEVHVSKSKALLSHRKKWEAKESEQEVVLAQTQESITTGVQKAS